MVSTVFDRVAGTFNFSKFHEFVHRISFHHII
jgi:hypothetical protein